MANSEVTLGWKKKKKDHHSPAPVSLEKHYMCSMLALVAKVSAVLDLFIYKVYTWDHYLCSKMRQRDSVVLLIEKSFPGFSQAAKGFGLQFSEH